MPMSKVRDHKDLMFELRNDYDRFAESGLYDLVHGGYKKDLELYKTYATDGGAPILEVMCGTGRLLVHLAGLGYYITGIDFSPVMVKKCLEKLKKDETLKSRIQVQVGDASNINLEESHFGLALIAYGSFGHLFTKENKLQALRCIKKHLRAEGLMIIDDINGIAWADKKCVKGLEWKQNEVLGQIPSDIEVRRFSKYKDDRSNRLMTKYDHIQVRSLNGEVKQEYRFEFRIAYASAEETVDLLREAGFHSITVYGTYHDAVNREKEVRGYDFSHPSSNERQIFIAK